MAYYLNGVKVGLERVSSLGDGQTINISWHQAYPENILNKIAYHIYYSTSKEKIFYEGIKYLCLDSLEANVINLVPGQMYFFCVRPVEYDPSLTDLENIIPIVYDNLRVYPYSVLSQNITSTDLIIPLVDVDGFPSDGIVKIGGELIRYLSVDSVNKNLVLTNIDQRGYNNTRPLIHNIDGYDGYNYFSPDVSFFPVEEKNIFDRIFMCQSRFEYPKNAYTEADGYHQVLKDNLSTDLTASDNFNEDFPIYDYAGYHRTDPVQLLTGACVGSYIGGEMGCIDGYGNFNILRGLTVQDHNNQRQEVLLSVTGRPAVLIKRVQTGITCSCYRPSSEYSDDRCPFCLGYKFVQGYQQFFNPRRSDGRILVRPGPADENTKMYEAGLESEFSTEFWTLTIPTIKTRDIIVLFDIDDNEEFRYEVLTVTRNNTVVGLQGGQKMKVQRIRKTDPAYQIRIFRNTSDLPEKFNTNLSLASGVPPHTHEIVRNEKDPSTWSQTTKVAQGHSHPVIIQNGLPVVMEALGHTHTIIV